MNRSGSESSGRIAEISRNTNETSIKASLNLDGAGNTAISTGVGFFDHMLEQLGRHAAFDLEIAAAGDLHVDGHHTVEDVGIVLGQALSDALGDKRGIRRFGSSLVPMEESLVQVALDLSGRPSLQYKVDLPAEAIGNYDPDLTEEFFVALSRSAAMTLHITQLAGRNSHHITEAVFKGTALALSMAVEHDPRRAGQIPSTKGTL